MPYKDKETQREAVKKAVEKHRGITKGITEQGITGEGITRYPALLYALVEKRAKLEAICQSLGKYRGQVTYGVGGPDFFMVSEMLECTAK